MRVAIDIDGVLNYVEKFQLKYGIPWFEKRGYSVVNKNGFDITDIFGCTEDVKKDFWKSCHNGGMPVLGALIFDFAKNSEARPGINELFKLLKENGDSVYIITERYATGRKSLFGAYNRSLVYEWFKKNGINISRENIVFVPENMKKEDVYRSMHIDVIVEDNPENLKAIERIEGLYAIAFNASYNKEYNHSNLFRANLPSEVFPIIKTIEGLKTEMANNKKIKRPKQFETASGVPSKDRVWRQYYAEEEENVSIPSMNMLDYLKERASKWPDAIMIEDDFGHRYTYKTFLDEIVPKYAKALVNFGVKTGEPVIIALPNLIAVQAAKFALVDIGAIPVMVNPLSSSEEFCTYLNTVINGKTPKVMLMFNRSANTVKEAMQRCGKQLEHIISIGVNSDFGALLNFGYKMTEGKNDPAPELFKSLNNVCSLKDFLDAAKRVETYDKAPYQKDNTAVIYFTGGTTGSEKAVEITNENAIAIAKQFSILVKNSEINDVTMNAMPWFHVFGDNQIFYFAACNGMTNYVIPKFNRKEVDKLFKRDIVNYNGVPAFLGATLANLSDCGRLKSIKKMISGGANLPYSTQLALNQALKKSGSNAVVEVGYGITEGAGGVCYTLVGTDKAGCIGIPTPGTIMKIVDSESGEELGYNQDGEICFSGPSVMKSYLNNPEETAKCLRTDEDGIKWFHSGDMGRVDENGLFYFSDRIKRIIIVSGENVYPNRVEKEVINHFGDVVAECFMISQPDAEKGEVPILKILLKPSVSPSIDLRNSIQSKVQETFHNKKYWPRKIDFIKSVPMTKMSKADYKRLGDPSLIVTLEDSKDGKEEKDKVKKNKVKTLYGGNRFYKTFHDIYSPLYKSPLFGRRIKYVGTENIPGDGNCIFAMNHLNAQDQNAILAHVDGIVSLPSKLEYFDKTLSNFFMTRMQMIPVDRYGDAKYAKEWIKGLINTIPCDDFVSDDRVEQEIINYVDALDVKKYSGPQKIVEVVTEYILSKSYGRIGEEAVARISAMPTSGKENGYGRALEAGKKIEEYLNAGRMVGVFPEGTRNASFAETGELLPFHSGTLYWARNTNTVIVPTAITGEHKQGGELLVRFGKPIYIGRELNDSEIKKGTESLRNSIYELVLTNLVEQETDVNNKALEAAIEHLKIEKNDQNELLLQSVNQMLRHNASKRNEALLEAIECWNNKQDA